MHGKSPSIAIAATAVVAGLAVLLVASLLVRARSPRRGAPMNATYYIALDGDDGNPGTTPGKPWKTVAPANRRVAFGKGCRILFKGGETFPGGLTVIMRGTARARCTIGSYGDGKATLTDLELGVKAICTLMDSEYVTVENLRLVGTLGTGYPGMDFLSVNQGCGLMIRSMRSTGARLRSVTVRGMEFRNTKLGLWIGADGSPNTDGFDGIRITGNLFDSVYQFGCYVIGYGHLKGGPEDQHLNVYVADNIFKNIRGDPLYASEAQPLSVSCATGIRIERNLFTDNCGYGGAKAGAPLGGSTAFGVSNCRNFVIRFNEVCRTGCSKPWDGSAIDLDMDTQNGEVYGNLTYDNDGPSIQFGSWGDHAIAGVAIHHNVSFNDVRGCQDGSIQGAIRIWGKTDGVSIFNNTVCVDAAGTKGVPSCVSFEDVGGPNTNLKIWNNIFKTTGGIPMIRPNGSGGGEYNRCHIDASNSFLANCYDSSGAPLVLSTDDAHGNYVDVTTLEQWRALDQEQRDGSALGIAADAGLDALATFDPPADGFLPATSLAKLGAFDIASGSACRGRAVNPRGGVTVESPVRITMKDIHGRSSALQDIGADTY